MEECFRSSSGQVWYYGHSMAVKVTFTLDEATIGRLNDTAKRLAKPKSEVDREIAGIRDTRKAGGRRHAAH